MALYTIADLHLACAVDKPMDIFGGKWQNYMEKILLKGNHDLWWNTVKKMTEFCTQNGYDDVSFLHNNCYVYDDVAICGTRGWFFEEDFQESHDEKIFRRELLRLETSLKAGRDSGAKERYCFLHYPPIYANFRCGDEKVRRDPLYLRSSALGQPQMGGHRPP